MDTPSLESLLTQGSLAEHLRRMVDALQLDIPPGRLSHSQITKLLEDLPRIEEKQLITLGEKDSSCPICFNPYLTILTEEEMALVMDTPAHPVEELGVTKLDKTWQCGHMFCRRDISKWIGSGHDSCPMCRRPLLETQAQAQPNADADAPADAPDQTPQAQAQAQAQEPTPPDAAAAAAAQHARAYADFARGMMELQRAMSMSADGNGETIPEGLLFEQFNGSFPGLGTGVGDSRREEREEEDRREFSGMYS